MKLRYTSRAASDLEGILDFIGERSPRGSLNVKRRIQTVARTLAERPGLGQHTDDAHLRRILAAPYPYLIFYETNETTVTIVGIRHAARDPRSMPGSSD